MADKSVFPINKGDEVEVRHDLNLWGFGYVSTNKGQVVELDSDPVDGHLFQQWAMGDINGDGKIDFALINNNQYEAGVDKPYNISLYIADDVDRSKMLEGVGGCTTGCRLELNIVARGWSTVLQEAQKTYSKITDVQKAMKARFLDATNGYSSFDGQCYWIEPNGKNSDIHLWVDGYKQGAEQCFLGKTEFWTPNIRGTEDGVLYQFAKTSFTDDEVKAVCSKIKGHKSYNK